MYLARKKIKGKTHYVLRESIFSGDRLTFRDLFELGSNPSKFIVYPGGNAYYINDKIEDKLNSLGIQPDADELEDLFWSFLKPDIKRAIKYFRHRSHNRKARGKLTSDEEEAIYRSVPSFDKRRAHYLKFGNIDQGPEVRMPMVLFKHMVGKSRDEIEQYFIEKELLLKETQLKTYVYVAFNLQQFFTSILAKKMPHVLDQNRVDNHFLEEICSLNKALFKGKDSYPDASLHEYLVRYLIMFFDNEYEHSKLLDEYVKDYIYRHRFPRQPPPEKYVSLNKASKIFGVKKEKLKNITKRHLTRLYRRLAQKIHPDKEGGSNEKFIALNEAYQSLLKRIKGR